MINLFNWVQGLVGFFTFWSGGGSGGGGNTTSTSYSTNLPEYAQPYYEELMKQTNKAVYSTVTPDMVGKINPSTGKAYVTADVGNVNGVQPMPTYTDERVAGMTPEQLAVQQQVQGMTTPTGFADAAQGLNTSQAMAGMTAAGGLSKALGYNPATVNAQSINGPSLQNYSMNSAAPVTAGSATSTAWSPQAAAYYSDPYQQGVTNIALREARRQADIAKEQGALGSISRGTFGGARQALMQGEAERNTQQNLGDIATKGAQSAYENAQKQFLADQQNRMTAQQLNIQSGLQAALANQQTSQQTNVQNLAAQLQTQGLSADEAMKAALANQQSNLAAQQSNQQAGLSAAQLAGQTGIAGLQAQTDAAKAQGALSATQQTTDLQRLQAQATSAAEKQALQQKIDDLAYQKFQEQQNYQKTQLEYLSNILRGNAGALGSTQVAYTPQPSTISQVAGLGLAGLGLVNALK